MKKIRLTEGQVSKIVEECVKKVITEASDRHRPGYYAEYAKKTGRKDRHKPGYYRQYNMAHPERLNRGFTRGYVNGNISDGSIDPRKKTADTEILGYDVMNRPITNNPLRDALDNKETEWHDDDWEEGID